MRHASKPRASAMLPRNAQKKAKPFASSIAVGSVRLPSDAKPVIATPRQIAAKIAAAITVACSENFMTVAIEDA